MSRDVCQVCGCPYRGACECLDFDDRPRPLVVYGFAQRPTRRQWRRARLRSFLERVSLVLDAIRANLEAERPSVPEPPTQAREGKEGPTPRAETLRGGPPLVSRD